MTAVILSMEEVNKLPSDLFIKIFGNVVEHYSYAAIGILKCRPFKRVEDIVEAFTNYLDSLSDNEKIKILQLHPDLAGKLTENEELTHESREEQKSAGLDVITPENKSKFNTLNEIYKKKFDFPFVICARENKVQAILSSITDRLQNEHNKELYTGIEEVKKISRLRIYQIVRG
ncbi:hypothetical protein Trydic_g7349 [Trypoxylus dichotomus]